MGFALEQPSLKKNIVLSTLYQILVVIAPLITTPYISRKIGATGLGIYSYTNSWQVYFSLFAALGTASYGTREIARCRYNEYERSKLFWEIELMLISTSAISIGGWFLFVSLQREYHAYYLVLTLNLINTMCDITWFYNGLELFQYTVTRNAICRIIGIILQFVLIDGPEDLLLYMLILSITTFGGTLTLWITLPRFVQRVKQSELHIKKHFKETWVYFIPTIASSVYTVLDKTLIGLITQDQNQNGYYEQASKIINLVKILTFSSVNSVLGSRTAYLFAQNRTSEVHKYIEESIDYVVFFGIGFCVGLYMIAPRFVPLFFGRQFFPVIRLLQLMSPLPLIIGFSNVLGSQYYIPIGRRKQSAKFIVIGACVNLFMNLLLIPRFSSVGAIIGSIIAEMLISVLYISHCEHYLTISLIWKINWKKNVAAFLMVCGMKYLERFHFEPIVMMLWQTLIGTCIYLGSLLLMHDSSIDIMKSLLQKGRKKNGKTQNSTSR